MPIEVTQDQIITQHGRVCLQLHFLEQRHNELLARNGHLEQENGALRTELARFQQAQAQAQAAQSRPQQSDRPQLAQPAPDAPTPAPAPAPPSPDAPDAPVDAAGNGGAKNVDSRLTGAWAALTGTAAQGKEPAGKR